MLKNSHSYCLSLAAITCLVFGSAQVCAQGLPPTSRTVFKCVVAGQTVYSDAPCLGAQKIEVEPTRGLNKSSGRVQEGSDVRRERDREIVAGAIRPITGMDAKQLDSQGRRMKLTAHDQKECRRLEAEIPVLEQKERRVKRESLEELQAQLFSLRRSFRDVGC